MSILEEPPGTVSPALMSSIPQDYTKRLMVFGGRASMELAARISQKLDVDLGEVDLRTFADGEVYCRYKESIRGADIFLVQSTAANAAQGMTPNDSLMELLAMIDAAKGASAHRIIAVMPWYGYSRQDKKSAPREPITARVVAQCLEAVGVDRVLTMDLHSGQVQGFFSKPVDHMTAMPMLTQYFIDQAMTDELVIVSPDAGRVKVARNFARKIGVHWAVMEKERPAQQVAEIGYVVGDVKDKTAVLVDDMIDTAGTLCAAAKTVLDEGAARVIACATHGVFSGPAFERLAYENSQIERIVVTDTIPLRPGAPDNIYVLSAAQTLADSIRRIFADDSVSEIFAGENQLFYGSALSRPPRGVAYRIDSQARTATLVDSQADPEALGSFCCGSAQMFPGGGWLIDWGGAVPTQITEFDPQHRRTFTFTFTFHGVSPATTYRVESLPDGRLKLGDLRKAMDNLAAKGLAAPASQ